MYELPVLIIIGGALYFFYKSKKRGPAGNVEIEAKTYVSSSTGGGDYEVNADSVTCQCPDFYKRRKDFAMSDPRRLCKHLMTIVASDNIDDVHHAAIFQNLQEKGLGYPLGQKFSSKIRGRQVTAFIGPDPNHPWVNVFVESDEYGYNIQEDRWSYGNEPPAPKTTEIWINKCRKGSFAE